MPDSEDVAWCCVATAHVGPVLEVFLLSLRASLPDARVVVFRPDRAPVPRRLAALAQFEPLNLGHWRIAVHDQVGRTADRTTWRGEPVSLLHMSGFDPAAPAQLSRYRPDLIAPAGSPLRELTERYAELVLRARTH